MISCLAFLEVSAFQRLLLGDTLQYSSSSFSTLPRIQILPTTMTLTGTSHKFCKPPLATSQDRCVASLESEAPIRLALSLATVALPGTNVTLEPQNPDDWARDPSRQSLLTGNSIPPPPPALTCFYDAAADLNKHSKIWPPEQGFLLLWEGCQLFPTDPVLFPHQFSSRPALTRSTVESQRHMGRRRWQSETII